MAEKKKEYAEKEMRESMVELKTGRRVFDTDKYGLLQIRFPKVEENRLADWEYSKVFQQAVLDGLPTNKEMERLIKDRKLWAEEDDKELEKLQDDINKQIVVLGKMDTEKNIAKAQEKIDELRGKIFAKRQERQRYFNNTAESKADESKMSFLIHKCTEVADTGKRVWGTYDDFKNEEEQSVVNQIVYQFLTFINGLPADLLQSPSVKSGETDEEDDDSK